MLLGICFWSYCSQTLRRDAHRLSDAYCIQKWQELIATNLDWLLPNFLEWIWADSWKSFYVKLAVLRSVKTIKMKSTCGQYAVAKEKWIFALSIVILGQKSHNFNVFWIIATQFALNFSSNVSSSYSNMCCFAVTSAGLSIACLLYLYIPFCSHAVIATAAPAETSDSHKMMLVSWVFQRFQIKPGFAESPVWKSFR